MQDFNANCSRLWVATRWERPLPPPGGVRPPPASDWGWRAYSGAQASFRRTLLPDWLRESDASVKEAQVGKPGRVKPPEGEMALLRGRATTPESIIPVDQRRVIH